MLHERDDKIIPGMIPQIVLYSNEPSIYAVIIDIDVLFQRFYAWSVVYMLSSISVSLTKKIC